VRYDGRAVLDLRHLIVQNGVIEFCNGSTLVERVHTSAKVLVGVKVEAVDLRDESEGSELFDVTIDCTSVEAGEEDPSQRRFRDFSRRLEALVEEQLREAVGDGSILHVVPNRFAWSLAVDVIVLGTDGNMSDLVSLAVFGALADTVLPKSEQIETEDGPDFTIDTEVSTAQALPAALFDRLPIRVSLFKLCDTMVADACEKEEECATACLSALVNRNGELCSTHIDKGGAVPLTSLHGHLSNVCQIASELFKLLSSEFSAANSAR